MIASVIFQCSKVSTTPIYAIIIENPVPPIITITGKKYPPTPPDIKGSASEKRGQNTRSKSKSKKPAEEGRRHDPSVPTQVFLEQV